MYRTVDAKFWHDAKVCRLSAEAKLFLLYLITNPHSHLSGIYYLPDVVAAHETGLSKPKLDGVWHTLSGAGLACRDSENQVVWIKNMLSYQGRGTKHDAAAVKQLQTLCESPLVEMFLAKYRRFRDRVSIPHPKLDQFGTPEQEQEQEQEKEKTPTESLSADADGDTQDEAAEFVAVWNSTPGVKRIGGMSQKRLATLRARLRTKVVLPDGERVAWFAALVLAVKKFPLPMTRGDPHGWRPDGDWILRPDSVLKILEGKYDWTKRDGRTPEPTAGLVYDPTTGGGSVLGW